MRIARMLRSITVAFGLGALAACAPTGGSGPVDPQRPVQVALLVPLGSDDPEREALGQSLVNAAELARGDLRGVDIDLTVYATAGDAQTAAEAAQTALAEGAEIFIGPLFSTATTAVAPIAASRSSVVLSFSNNPQVAGGNVYLLGNTFDSTAERIVGYTVGQGLTRLSIVHPQGAEGQMARDAVQRAAQRAGGEVVHVGSYPLSVEGISDEISGVAQAARLAGPDAMVLTDGPTGGLTFAAESLRGLGVRADQVKFVGLQRWDTSPQALAQPSLEEGWFPGPDQLLVARFADRYEAAYGRAPHALAGLAYDGVAAVGALLAETQAEGARDPFSAARLTKPAGFAGVTGIFRFMPDGTIHRALAVYEVDQGLALQIDPAPRSFGTSGS